MTIKLVMMAVMYCVIVLGSRVIPNAKPSPADPA
jgi:hypothetical protein